MNEYEAHDPSPSGSRRSWIARRLLSFGRWIVEREELPRANEETPRRSTANTIGWLARQDRLGRHAAPPHHTSAILRWLAAKDQLPSRDEPPRRRFGFLPWLLSREKPPTAALGHDAEHWSFLHWFFTPEHFPSLTGTESTKEVSSDES